MGLEGRPQLRDEELDAERPTRPGDLTHEADRVGDDAKDVLALSEKVEHGCRVLPLQALLFQVWLEQRAQGLDQVLNASGRNLCRQFHALTYRGDSTCICRYRVRLCLEHVGALLVAGQSPKEDPDEQNSKDHGNKL